MLFLGNFTNSSQLGFPWLPRARVLTTFLLHGDSQTRDISRNLTMMAMATGPKSPAVSAKLLMYLRWCSCRNGEEAMKYGHPINNIA
jgi:hypothetical protein